jgi:hypothetical protein
MKRDRWNFARVAWYTREDRSNGELGYYPGERIIAPSFRQPLDESSLVVSNVVLEDTATIMQAKTTTINEVGAPAFTT